MRRLLDLLYEGALWLAAGCLVAIALLVGLQLLGRIADGLSKLAGFGAYGFVILSLSEIAGFLLAGASFLALAATLKSGAHIRVAILLAAVGETKRRWFELWSLAFAGALTAYITVNIARFAFYSWTFNDVSHGLVAVPLAIPQAVMALGALVLTIALIDEFIIVLRRGRPTFRATEEALTLGKEG